MSNITEEELAILIDQYPFLSAISYNEKWSVGIIQNVENQFIWFYDFSMMKTPTEKQLFLQYGYDWYSQSNMEIPIEMFIGSRFDQFQYALKGFNKKLIDDTKGHEVNLSETFERRIKKKKIEIKVVEPNT